MQWVYKLLLHYNVHHYQNIHVYVYRTVLDEIGISLLKLYCTSEVAATKYVCKSKSIPHGPST